MAKLTSKGKTPKGTKFTWSVLAQRVRATGAAWYELLAVRSALRQDKIVGWCFQMKCRNGRILFNSDNTYSRKADAKRAIKTVHMAVSKAGFPPEIREVKA